MKNILTQYGGLKKEIYILFIGRLVTAMGSFVWPMLTFFLTTKLGLSDGLSTFVIAAASVVSLPVALLGGKLADRFSRKRIIIVFDLLTVSLYVTAAIVPIGYHTAALVFLAGLFQTAESPAYDALNADFSTMRQREKAFSLSYLGFNLGYVVGASIAGLLFEFHTNLAFLLNGLSIFISTVLIAFFVHPANAIRDTGTGQESYGEYERPCDEKLSILTVLRQRKAVGWIILISCLAYIPGNVVSILLPLQLKESMGQAGAAVYGYLNSLNGFVVILFTPILTMLLRRITEIPKSITGVLLFVSGLVLFARATAQWVLFVGMFIYTLGEVVTVLGSNPYTSRRIPASHRGRIGGMINVLRSVFTSLTQFGMSFALRFVHGDYGSLWMTFIICGVGAAVLYAAVYRADRRSFPILYEEMRL